MQCAGSRPSRQESHGPQPKCTSNKNEHPGAEWSPDTRNGCDGAHAGKSGFDYVIRHVVSRNATNGRGKKIESIV
jgi:hypothetical protein